MGTTERNGPSRAEALAHPSAIDTVSQCKVARQFSTTRDDLSTPIPLSESLVMSSGPLIVNCGQVPGCARDVDSAAKARAPTSEAAQIKIRETLLMFLLLARGGSQCLALIM